MFDDVEVFERSYADRHGDLRRDRGRIPLRDCANPSCKARVAAGIPHCCTPCRDADLNGAQMMHSPACQARQIERGVQL